MSCPYCRASVVVPEELRQVLGPATWSILLFDGFTANENNWLVGNLPSEHFSKLNQTIAEGRYRWEAQSRLPYSMSSAWLAGYPVSDFHVIANCKHIRGSRAGSSCGVVFRVQDTRNCYWFQITDNQFFSVSVVKEGQWQDLVDWTRKDIIKPYGVNQVEAIAYGTHFTFLINGQIVGEMDDEHFRKGLVGLAIQANTLREEITFDFLDILLRAP